MLNFYREELPKPGWQLDYQNGKCVDDRRVIRCCMGWHGDDANSAHSPIIFLRGGGEYLTLNALEGNGKANVVIGIDPNVY